MKLIEKFKTDFLIIASKKAGTSVLDFNLKNYSDNISSEEKNTLLDFYKEEILETEELLDRDCKGWLN